MNVPVQSSTRRESHRTVLCAPTLAPSLALGSPLRHFRARTTPPGASDCPPDNRAALDLLVTVITVDVADAFLQKLCEALTEAGAVVRVLSSLRHARRFAGPLALGATVVWGEVARAASLSPALQGLSRHGPVIAVHVEMSPNERVTLLDAGADSVVTSADAAEVVAALRASIRRSLIAPSRTASTVLRAGLLEVDTENRAATVAGLRLELSPLEFDLLSYFTLHAGETLSRDRLLKRVWRYDLGGRDTVTVHVCRLRGKLERDPARPLIIETVWGLGYRLNREALAVPVAP